MILDRTRRLLLDRPPSRMASSPASLDSISPLVETFPALSAPERAILLDWTRQTPLVYGAWKPFKALYKKVEATISTSAPDLELMGALLGRLDAALIPAAVPRLQPSENHTISDGKAVTTPAATFTIGGRRSYDWSGFRLVAQYGANTSGLKARLENLRRVFGLAANETAPTDRATWDFNGHDYIGGIKKVGLEDGVLSIETQYQNKKYAIDVSDPTFPHFPNQSPLPATWQYMKRRARRLLREQSRKNPDLYWKLLGLTLHETLKAQSTLKASQPDALNFATQWASVDALFAGGGRWVQKRAGRGSYRLAANAGFNRLRREERAPEIWDAHREDVARIYNDDGVPVEACATALKVLWAHHQPVPTLSGGQILRFLNGPIPVLQAVATRSVLQAWENGEAIAGATAGAAYLLAGGRIRKRLVVLVETRLSGDDAKWKGEFAAQLLQTLDGATDARAKNRRRVRTAGALLAERLTNFIDDKALFRHLEMWLAASEESAMRVLERLKQSGARGETKRLDAIAALPEVWRERAIEAFISGASSAQPSINAAAALITHIDADLNALGWRYLAATSMKPENIRALYTRLMSGWFSDPVFGPAFSNASALQLFERAAWSAKDVAKWTQGYVYYTPWRKMLPHASADFFLAALRFLPAPEAPRQALLALSWLRAEVAREVAPRLAEWARDYQPTKEDLLSQTWTAPVWQYVASSTVEPSTLLEMWPTLWQRPIDAASAPFAIALLERAALSDDLIADWLPTIPEIKAQFAPEFFAHLLRRVPGESKVLLMLGATEEQWQWARPILLEMLRDEGLRGGFWNGIWEQLRGDNRAAIVARLQDDSALNLSFERIDKSAIEAFLATTEPAHEPFLLRWMDAHQSTLGRDDVALIAAATCPLPAVRERGLNRVREVGLDLPLSLRLMESNLPPAVALGRSFFDAAPEGSEDETNFALALCDSPQATVRAYGREFIAARQKGLLRGDLLEKLAENSDPLMQSWVGEQWLAAADEVRSGAETRSFDGAVLRARGRSRRAKEAVKTRIAQAPVASEVDVEALLETARGTTTADREWALQQLAALAISGQEIPGVEIKTAG